ncbi:DNA replication/repair protein RecF [Pseudostreptobacillus hongkongensis]|uniref:DNA replication/repair protein RecF n=1 Tax=Pseudostreptobacillus hongkongensis TaxID=1162717 RepID=UPI0008329236|nr:DNA replication and repair protein RecF [Pseudostreptobacillus hongkongensis]
MIKEIYFSGFRNLKDKKVKLSRGFNLIYGQNAQGKTSFMEAVYFGATGKSFRTKKNSEMINYDVNDAKVFIKLEDMSNYSINLFKDEKKYYKNGEKIKYIDYIGDILAVSFIPEDVELVMGNPSIRRTFFNYEISQINRTYLEAIVNYEKILKVRNKYLKEKKIEDSMFEIYNEKYVELCAKILLIRNEYINELNNILDKNYKELFNEEHTLVLKYENFMKLKEFEDIEKLKNEIREFLKSKQNSDLLVGFSNYGIHKDEYIFELNNKNARYYSSQGEKKSIVFVLKISEIELIENKFNKKPIFLMDDITSFFDNFRKNQIINYFLEKEIQCFLTSTEDLKIVGKKYIVDGGVINEEFI